MTFSPEEQLKILIDNLKQRDRIEAIGLMLDYIVRTGVSFDNVFDRNIVFRDAFNSLSLLGKQNAIESVNNECEIFRYANSAEIVEKYPELAESAKNLYTRKIEPTINDRISYKEIENHKHFEHTIFWHLSDLHFGKLNTKCNDPKEMAFKYLNAINEFGEVRPDYILITGDLTCIASDDEFGLFGSFIDSLSKGIWDEDDEARIIIIPGNHDTHWEDDAKNDKMMRFRNFCNDRCLINPYSDMEISNARVMVNKIDSIDNMNPPGTAIHIEPDNIDLLLVVSSFFAGEADDKLRKIYLELRDKNIDEMMINEIIRKDIVRFKDTYYYCLDKLLQEFEAPIRLALIHHNLTPYGEAYISEDAQKLLQLFIQYKIKYILHGHIHASLTAKFNSLRLYSSSTTGLSPWKGDCGFNLYTVNSHYGCLHAFKWNIDQNEQFTKENIRGIKPALNEID